MTALSRVGNALADPAPASARAASAALLPEAPRLLVCGDGTPDAAAELRRIAAFGSAPVASVGVEDADGAAAAAFSSVRSALAAVPADAALLLGRPDRLPELVEAGIRLLVVAGDASAGDVAHHLAAARRRGRLVVGPGGAGVYRPGTAAVGPVPPDLAAAVSQGRVAVLARARGSAIPVCRILTDGGLGQSALVVLGSGRPRGLGPADALSALAADPRTDAVLVVVEPDDHAIAELPAAIARCGRPVVVVLTAPAAPSDGARDSALACAGAILCRSPEGAPDALRAALHAHRGVAV